MTVSYLTQLPVLEQKSGFMFWNVFCAICNRKTDLIRPWGRSRLVCTNEGKLLITDRLEQYHICYCGFLASFLGIYFSFINLRVVGGDLKRCDLSVYNNLLSSIALTKANVYIASKIVYIDFIVVTYYPVINMSHCFALGYQIYYSFLKLALVYICFSGLYNRTGFEDRFRPGEHIVKFDAEVVQQLVEVGNLTYNVNTEEFTLHNGKFHHDCILDIPEFRDIDFIKTNVLRLVITTENINEIKYRISLVLMLNVYMRISITPVNVLLTSY